MIEPMSATAETVYREYLAQETALLVADFQRLSAHIDDLTAPKFHYRWLPPESVSASQWATALDVVRCASESLGLDPAPAVRWFERTTAAEDGFTTKGSGVLGATWPAKSRAVGIRSDLTHRDLAVVAAHETYHISRGTDPDDEQEATEFGETFADQWHTDLLDRYGLAQPLINVPA